MSAVLSNYLHQHGATIASLAAGSVRGAAAGLASGRGMLPACSDSLCVYACASELAVFDLFAFFAVAAFFSVSVALGGLCTPRSEASTFDSFM